ncbi:MAG: symmetrical bis(5'-nucleosyl)-tetraphosphatase [Pseudomonadota bacterium]
MALYAIGDLQGCYDPFAELLDRLRFEPGHDRLWLTGDLVNRGKQSLQTLRRIYAMRRSVKVVLGNHDLALLRLWMTGTSTQRGNELKAIVNAPDGDEMLHWLLKQPLVRHSKKHNAVLVHAGIPPAWSVDYALARSRELSKVLTGDGAKQFFANMYGADPAQWNPKLRGHDRYRHIVNAFTRMRLVTRSGKLDLSFKGPPARAPEELKPWFEIRRRAARSTMIVFGHWAALGFVRRPNLLSLDTGCVWGRKLTAVRIDKARARPVAVQCRCA